MSNLLACITDDPRCEYDPTLPEGDYRDADGLGSTDVRRLDTSVREWLDWRAADDDHSDAMRLGTLIHLAALQPDRWQDVCDQPDPPSAADKLSSSKLQLARLLADDPAQSDHALSDAVGVTVGSIEKWRARGDIQRVADYRREHGDPVSDDMKARVIDCRDAVLAHLDEGDNLGLVRGNVDAEASFFWSDDDIQCKGRADAIAEVGGRLWIVDLKTTGRYRARPQGDHANAGGDKLLGSGGAHIQAAHYSEGVAATRDDAPDAHEIGVVYIIVETGGVGYATDDTVHVKAGTLDQESRHAGYTAHRDALERLRAYDEGGWDGYDPSLATFSIPKYLR